jgi:hypothetical protein
MFISYIFPRFGILCPEKSGNPATHPPNRWERLQTLYLF